MPNGDVIQLQIRSGKQADRQVSVCRFPFVIGRESEADLQLDDPGVWERHLEVTFQRGDGYLCAAQPGAMLLLNHQRIESGVLRNGDLIELGSIQLRFWLAPCFQKSTRVREALTWASLAALFVAQITLICWLLR